MILSNLLFLLLRAIIPKEKICDGHLVTSDIDKKNWIASNRMILENIFGRVINIWGCLELLNILGVAIDLKQ